MKADPNNGASNFTALIYTLNRMIPINLPQICEQVSRGTEINE